MLEFGCGSARVVSGLPSEAQVGRILNYEDCYITSISCRRMEGCVSHVVQLLSYIQSGPKNVYTLYSSISLE